MKKIFRKISYGLSIFVLGAQSRIFARDRSVAVYGPAPDPIRNATGLGPGQILSIIVTLILFMLGIMVALNKGIKKNVKIISLSIISVVIVILILLTIFVF